MKSFAVLLAAVAAVASPLHTRNVGGILLCNGPDATGTCEHKVFKLDTCYNITAPYVNATYTFAPDGDDFYCYPYAYSCGGQCTSPEGCTLGRVDFGYRYKYNLSAVSWTAVKSFSCHRKESKKLF